MKPTPDQTEPGLINHPLRSLFIATIVIIGIGMLFYHTVEGLGWIDAFYFSVVTLTTVGYGDISPQTDLGKIFTVFYILTGIGIMFAFINNLYSNRVDRFRQRREKSND